MSGGLSEFMSTDDKARDLLMRAWLFFCNRVTEAINEYEPEVIEHAEKIIRGTD